MRGVRITLSKPKQSSSSAHRLLIVHVERDAAEPAGAQRLEQRVAVDDRRVGDVDDAGAGLDPRQFGAADQVARVGQGRHLRHDPVAFGQQRRQRNVGRLQFALLGLRGAGALMIEHAHAEGRGAQRNLAPDLAEANDADGRTVERAGAADARIVAARRVAAVERPQFASRRLRSRAGVTSPLTVSSLRASVSISAKACSAQEMLARRRMVRTLMPFAAQAAVSMLRRPVPNFCTTLSAGPRRDRPRRRKRLHHQRAAPFKRGAHLVLRRHHPHFGGIEARRAGAHALHPAVEIRLVMRHEVGEGARRSFGDFGSSTIGISRVNGSSSTTMMGRPGHALSFSSARDRP